jgi:hypothetical protein
MCPTLTQSSCINAKILAKIFKLAQIRKNIINDEISFIFNCLGTLEISIQSLCPIKQFGPGNAAPNEINQLFPRTSKNVTMCISLSF